MAAGAIGTCWASGSWLDTTWEAQSWAGAAASASTGHSHWVGYEPRNLWSNSPRYVRATHKHKKSPRIEPVPVRAPIVIEVPTVALERVLEAAIARAAPVVPVPVPVTVTVKPAAKAITVKVPPTVPVAAVAPVVAVVAKVVDVSADTFDDDEDALLWILSVAA